MKRRWHSAGLWTCILSSFADLAHAEEPVHFFDSAGNSLERFEVLWEPLKAFYQDSMPEPIRIRHHAGSSSMFHPPSKSISIASKHYEEDALPVIAHESCHLGLASLTDNLSTTTTFRFLDEGWASCWEARVRGNDYRSRAFDTAALAHRKAPLSLDQVRDWKTFYEESQNPAAYPVGATWVYLLLDQGGEERLRQFFSSLAPTRSLERSLLAVYGKTASEMEQAWLRLLAERTVAAPAIVSMFPANGQQNVSVGIRELVVTFSVPMRPGSTCLSTRCDEGICYTNAKWRDARTLVIEVPRPLHAKHEYSLSLGTRECRLQSEVLAELPMTRWSFATGDLGTDAVTQ